MKKKNIKLKITSEQYDVSDALFASLAGEDDELPFDDFGGTDEPEGEDVRYDGYDTIEMTTDAVMKDDGERIEISYDETELTGMSGAVTAVSFNKNEPGLVTMLRGGSVRTALVFEEGQRNICTYETPYMPFELCICTRKVENELEFGRGRLFLDYMVEIRGAKAERTKFNFEII